MVLLALAVERRQLATLLAEEANRAARGTTPQRQHWSTGSRHLRRFRICRTVWLLPWLETRLRRVGAWRSGPRPAKLAARTASSIERSALRPRLGDEAPWGHAAGSAVAASMAMATALPAVKEPGIASPTSECDGLGARRRPRKQKPLRGARVWLRERLRRQLQFVMRCPPVNVLRAALRVVCLPPSTTASLALLRPSLPPINPSACACAIRVTWLPDPVWGG